MKELGNVCKKPFKSNFNLPLVPVWPILIKILVGIVVGCIVSSFRFDRTSALYHFVQGVYKEMSGQPRANDTVGMG